MPAQTQRVSRRSLLRGAAGVSAVGLAAATGAVAIAGPRSTAGPVAGATAGLARPDHQGPVMVYLRDAATGEMDVFAGTGQVTLRDPALATQLLRAIQ
jgi:hypothetical protein